jgi:hypothetical protein
MMSQARRQPMIFAWLVLVGLTVVLWILGDQHQSGASAVKLASVVVTIVAFLKVIIVSQSFMELRRAAPALQLAIVIWCVVVGSIVVSFLLAS